MEQFMLIFRNEMQTEEAYESYSPEQMQAELQKWGAWIGGIAAQGKMVSSEGLYSTGKMVKGSNHIITDGPFTESKELVSGFMILKADNIEEAIELSKGCPIYEIEGTVEVRQIQNFG